WRELPGHARRAIRDRRLQFLVVDAFSVARKHAPKPELETRMMGIAFIGAVIGHVDRISQGATAESIDAKVRAQITAKFGRKGEAVVEGNMSVIRDGMSATQPVDYDDPAFLAVEAAPAARVSQGVALSAAMCPAAAGARTSGLFDPGYYEDLVARPFREGTISEAPVLPGAGLFMPVGSGAAKDKGIFRRTVPVFDPKRCTGCLECSLVCPDSAIPTTVHEIHDLLSAAIDTLDLPAAQAAALTAQAPAWSEGIRAAYRSGGAGASLAGAAREAAAGLDQERALTRHLDAVAGALDAYPVSRTRPFFDAMEKATPGTGGLFASVVDPWKCTGCLQCVDVCGPKALTPTEQDADVFAQLETRFERLAALPNTPKRFTAGATDPDGDPKRILLDHANYYAMTGGHGACRGCGEVTATRLITSLSRALGTERRRAHERELERLVAQLAAKLDSLPADDAVRRARIEAASAELERALYLCEGGPTGQGPAPTVVANSTGCSSVYASTMPFTPYLDPWVNSLFQDAQPLAVGIFEGLVAKALPEVKALRTARLELDDSYTPGRDDSALAQLTWHGFTPEELGLLPVLLTISGDGAAFDIGFGAMSRVLAGGTPIKSLVLDTGAYSNTGGQASTASYTGQDADLARHGKAHNGKREHRKELALLASFHPNVFACTTSTALHAHFLATAAQLLGYKDGAALMVAYTPCGTENGFAEDLSATRSRLAVQSRMSPVFVHDPRGGQTLPERFSLDGNPDPDKTWTTSTLQYVDPDGQVQLLTTPLTPAEFALGEVRFAKQFRKLRPADEGSAVPIAEYVDLPPDQRAGRIPCVLATDGKRRLIKVGCSAEIVALVEDRRHYWQTLRFLAGQGEVELAAEHRAEVAALQAQYAEAVAERDASLDAIAATMAELATSAAAPATTALAFAAAPGAPASSTTAPATTAAPAAGGKPIWLDPADEPKCVDCGTCYQELPQLFEKATILVDGQAQTVGRMRAGALDGLEVTPEIAKRIARVKATCDAEIIK
ncbi:MAG: 4Fe-4S binding protein, partial [Bifidobacteriaceae bacterium]|nr:4Fe-4S binding protein [Bifidobacteriaceae bacterium]